jgi:hypothetical protein
MIKSLKVAVLALAVSVVALNGNPALAASPGQLAGGDNYVVKNVTKGGAYADSVSATCGDTVKFSMQLSNTQFGALDDVTLTTTVPANGGVSTATATTSLGGESGTTDTASVTLGANQKLSYKSGSANLYDGEANLVRTLSGDITKGINLGTIDGSTTRFVDFQANVDCPEKPACTQNCTPVTPPKTPTPSVPVVTPSVIPSTGPEALFGGLTGVSALGYGVSRFIQSRRER